MYAATHFGLWLLGEDGDAERVGEAAHDFMGFTVVGADHFVASGHPPLTADGRLLVAAGGAIRESVDDGRSWTDLYREG